MLAVWFHASAIGQQIGSSEVIFDYDNLEVEPFVFEDHTASTVGITTADGEFWFAVEHHEKSTPFVTAGNLDLFWDDGSLERKPLSTGQMSADAGQMLPSLVTWPGETFVYTVGKQDFFQAEIQYEFFRQDRDLFSAGFVSGPIGTISGDIHHGRPHLTFDHATSGSPTDQMYICWTEKDVSESSPDDDLKTKAKNAGDTWGSEATHDLDSDGNTTVTNDHCHQDFDHDGYRYAVMHSDKDAHEGIYLDIEEWNASIDYWASYGNFELPLPVNHANADFPAVSVGAGSVASYYMAVAQSLTAATELLWWECPGLVRTGCDVSTDWDEHATNLSGQVKAPRVLFADAQAIVVYEDDSGGSEAIRIATKCGTATDFTDAGPLAAPNGNYAQFRFGALAGESMDQIVYDEIEEKIHVVFVGKHTTTGIWNPIHWEEPLYGGDLCP